MRSIMPKPATNDELNKSRNEMKKCLESKQKVTKQMHKQTNTHTYRPQYKLKHEQNKQTNKHSKYIPKYIFKIKQISIQLVLFYNSGSKKFYTLNFFVSLNFLNTRL